ncbi:hypothetical protein [Streptomyces sp. NPDC088733]|uniref:hypothetical protein n=1 Tax=Streptomyces sp. NPDC088733 TaxID=3365880 RepID=UPI00380DAF16
MSKTSRNITKAPEAPAATAAPRVTVVAAAVPAADADAAARRARFGALPKRIRPQDTTEVVPLVDRYPSQDHYDHEKWLTCRFV